MIPHSASSNGTKRDLEDRLIDTDKVRATREKMLDKTLADSFPASDPLSTLPDPTEDSFFSFPTR
jgi:hypothetical protein